MWTSEMFKFEMANKAISRALFWHEILLIRTAGARCAKDGRRSGLVGGI
jgi:hypothetical protein